MMMMLLNHVDEKPNKGEESNKAGNENKEDGANKESSGVSNPDEAQMNNIDLGGVLNLAAEDTLNIRLEPPLRDFLDFHSFLERFLFREFMWNLHYMWSLPLKIVAIIGLVYTKLGFPAALVNKLSKSSKILNYQIINDQLSMIKYHWSCLH